MVPTTFPTSQQLNELFRALHTVITWLPWLGLCFVIGIFIFPICIAIFRFALKSYQFYVLFRVPTRTLELIPQATTESSTAGMQQFLAMLHGYLSKDTTLDRLLGRKNTISLEMRSTRHSGISYLLTAPQPILSHLVLYFSSYMPNLQTRFLSEKEATAHHKRQSVLVNFKQSDHFAYSLDVSPATELVDPLSYIHGAMSSLTNDESMSVQLVLSPLPTQITISLRSKLVHNELHLRSLSSFGSITLEPLLRSLCFLSFAVTDSVTAAYQSLSSDSAYLPVTKSNYDRQVAAHIKPARSLSKIEQAITSEMHKKLSDDLYRVNIRTLIESDDPERLRSRAQHFKKTLESFRSTNDQSLKSRMNLPLRPVTSYNSVLFRRCLPSLLERNTSIFSATELSQLFHFQSDKKPLPESVQKHHNPELPLPPVLRARADNKSYDVTIGRNTYQNEHTLIGLTAKEREKHLFMVGGTGNGKTTMLQHMIEQDIASGKGVAVIDPHGDLAQALLSSIPKKRLDDVIYLNPVDISHPIGINLLEIPNGLSEEADLLEKAKVSSTVISVMRKVFSDDSERAFRIESVLRNTIQTALSVEGATLFTLPKLLRNSAYRMAVVARLSDDGLKDFWYEEIGRAGSMQVVNMTKSVTQRIDHFKASAHIYRMFGQAKSTIDFDDIINTQKILICNLGFGAIGEDEAILLGTTILAKLKLAAERRISLPIDIRKPFYLYVDEFQNFATNPFVAMLSSSRKYKLFLTMAEQSTRQQLSENLTETILANVGTVVCFRTGSHRDEDLMIHKFEPYLEKSTISQLPAHRFACRLQAEESYDPFTGETIVPSVVVSETATPAEVVNASRRLYARDYDPTLLGLKPKKSPKAKTRTR